MSGKRFVPNSFQYNGRVALALVPCLLVACLLCGKPVVATLTVGSIMAYLMDALQYRDGAFTCSWVTLAATDLAFIACIFTTSEASNWILVCMLFTMNATVAILGMWMSLQFKWLALQHPGIALLFEHVVLTASMPVSATFTTLGLASLVGFSEIPYYLAAVLAVLYYFLGRPLPSSFYTGSQQPGGSGATSIGGGLSKQHASDTLVQNKVDGVLMASLTCILPSLLYGAIHLIVLGKAVHIYSMVLLASLPLLFISLVPRGLWWLPGGPRTVSLLQQIIVSAALFSALVGFEGRVVFYAFGQYIKLQPPWDWLAVTVALFGGASVCLLHFLGALGSVVDVTVAGSFLLLCATAGSLAAGIPIRWLPAPLVAASGLALFFDSRNLREYIVFSGGAFMTGVWFVFHHFWFLDITVGSFHLHELCKLTLAALVPALLVPGLVFARVSSTAISSLLLLQAALLCVLEEQLYVPSHADFADEVMYPGYLVVLTSALGIVAVQRLRRSGSVGPLASWALYCCHAGKLSMLVLPEAKLVAPAVLLAAAVSSPLFLHEQDERKSRHAGANGVATSASSASSSMLGVPRSARRLRLAPWQGILHAAAVVSAVLLARFAIFDAVQLVTNGRPGEGVLLGSLVLAAAAGCLPLVTRCYASNQVIVRAIALAAMAGVLLVLLQPPLPIKGGARCPDLPLSLCPRLWDERHVPLRSVEDVEIWGKGMARKEHWPRWLLVAAVLAGVLAATSGGPAARSVQGRIAFAAIAGLLVGSYIALEVVPGQVVLQGLVISCSVCVIAFVAVLQRPGAGGSANVAPAAATAPLWLPWLVAAWAVAAGLTMLLHAELTPPAVFANSRLFPDSKAQVENEVFAATRASLLGVFAAHSLLLAFSLKLKMSAALRYRDRPAADVEGPMDAYLPMRRVPTSAEFFCNFVPAGVFQQFGRMLKLPGAAGAALSRLQQAGLGWVPTLGNACTLLAFFLCVVLNNYLTGGAPEAILMLAPLLLLLSRDPFIFPGLGEVQRYFPPAIAITAYLLLSSVSGAVEQAGWGSRSGTGSDVLAPGQHPVLHVLWNVGLAAAAVPTQYLFLHYLMTQRPRPGELLLATAPLNLLPLTLSDVQAAKYLAALGLAASVLQYFAMKHARHVGMRVI